MQIFSKIGLLILSLTLSSESFSSSITYQNTIYNLDPNGYFLDSNNNILRGKPITIYPSRTQFGLVENVYIPPSDLTLTFDGMVNKLGRTVYPANPGNFTDFNIDIGTVHGRSLGLLYDNNRPIALYMLQP